MREKLAKLLDVKSILTVLVTIVFCVLSLTGRISEQQFMVIFTTIVSFFFGVQYQKKEQQ